ncbi:MULTISPECIES: Spy/CpxP family protein refolding chaperone [unclassified Massilia]|uniref:Spy/CpxP family protein refolding chaperone n=1 Tax=unclassified Massilia TaxID=2609279 RepID=UPI001781CEBC|nr:MULTISPECIES: Spy/CpxP family protein refolding chaperone [unclassified Massilia]MBD8533158.1 Spy/CpxP family protein refolding chaperone [Massilia sp. CFBP 13647]MBD8676613.1 Spy/CpxP family protein refolding chaperone [Massilia sp. CFBP 13721]
MNTFRKNLVIALSALGIAGAAVAQTAAVQPAEGRHGHAVSVEQRAAIKAERQAKRAERQAQHAAKLRAELKITAQQEPAFAAYLAAGKPAQRPDARGGERTRLAALPAPQRLEQQVARQKQRTARMEARLAALNNLYAVLTPEQKQVLDSKAMRFGGKHRGHGGHRGHHGERGAALQS